MPQPCQALVMGQGRCGSEGTRTLVLRQMSSCWQSPQTHKQQTWNLELHKCCAGCRKDRDQDLPFLGGSASWASESQAAYIAASRLRTTKGASKAVASHQCLATKSLVLAVRKQRWTKFPKAGCCCRKVAHSSRELSPGLAHTIALSAILRAKAATSLIPLFVVKSSSHTPGRDGSQKSPACSSSACADTPCAR